MNATATKARKIKVEESLPTYKEWLDESPTNGFVYFIAANKRIKIGSARDAHQRLRELQTGCPNEMLILGLIPSGCPQALEQVMHHTFRKYRVPDRREWYEMTYSQL